MVGFSNKKVVFQYDDLISKNNITNYLAMKQTVKYLTLNSNDLSQNINIY